MLNLHPLMRLLAERDSLSLAMAAQIMGVAPPRLAAAVDEACAAGLPVERTGDRLGLRGGIDVLDPRGLRRAIDAVVPSVAFDLEVHAVLDSTNAYLMRRLAHLSGAPGASMALPAVCVTEFQSAGRGRRGRSWYGPFGASVLVSIAWVLAPGTRLEGLSLAIGVGVVQGLRALGVAPIGLKWPNDVLAGGEKAAGILVETRQVPGLGQVVIPGVGLNVRSDSVRAGAIDQPWTTVDTLLGQPSERTAVAGAVIGHILAALERFSAGGFAALSTDWEDLDLCTGRAIRLHTNDGELHAIGRGVDADGALRAEVSGTIRTFHSAEVSLRLDAGIAEEMDP